MIKNQLPDIPNISVKNIDFAAWLEKYIVHTIDINDFWYLFRFAFLINRKMANAASSPPNLPKLKTSVPGKP